MRRWVGCLHGGGDAGFQSFGYAGLLRVTDPVRSRDFSFLP
jgi:hypothetical protein